MHEIKHDGYRLIARRNGERVRLYTRRGFNWADLYPRIVEALRSLPVRSIVIDGEAVVCRAGTCPTAPGDAGVGSRSRTRRAWPCCGYRMERGKPTNDHKLIAVPPQRCAATQSAGCGVFRG